jgi:hypothetical protein
VCELSFFAFCFLACQRKAIAAELQGHVKEATESPHANYVLQKATLWLPWLPWLRFLINLSPA